MVYKSPILMVKSLLTDMMDKPTKAKLAAIQTLAGASFLYSIIFKIGIRITVVQATNEVCDAELYLIPSVCK